MFEINVNELIKVVGGEVQGGTYSNDRRIQGITIDSRKTEKGNLFVAIPGEKFDGHQFLNEVIEKGAAAVVVGKEEWSAQLPEISARSVVVAVSDTKLALRDLASWYREKFDIPVVAVTGTNGKTTTKDMTAQVLSTKYQVLKSPESYNNTIGVPLTIFQLDPSTEILVLELGMSSPGEIETLTRLSRPKIGVITNIGPAHLESMQNMEKIAQAKFELPDNMPSPRTLVLNADDKVLAKRLTPKRPGETMISFGINSKADFVADRIQTNGNGYVGFRVNQGLSVNLPLLGYHNVYNALAAFAVGDLLGVEKEEIKRNMECFAPSRLRMELVRIGDINIINDSYNANPVSMEKSLETLKNLKASGRKIAVLGDMLELGEESLDFHLQVGRKAAKLGIDLLILVGELARFIGEGAKESGMRPGDVLNFENNQEVSFYLLENLKDGDLVLVKGSRRMKTEEIVVSLKSQYGRQN
jgi:UDP-N-acetylmuramoyl-tripeptide--D-alanyl-D-alanine ligase